MDLFWVILFGPLFLMIVIAVTSRDPLIFFGMVVCALALYGPMLA
jgi:hypothetical protein